MRIWLVRHAATSWSGMRYCGRSDPALSGAGRRDAQVLAAQLGVRIDGAVVLSAPARRARDTAALLGRPLRVDERLREVDFGDAEGLTFDELTARYPGLARRLAAGATDIDWPGGERSAELERRTGELWHELVAGGRDAVIVSHGGPLRSLTRHALGREVTLAPCEHVVADGPPWPAGIGG